MKTENIKLDAYKLISLDKIPSTQDWAHDLIANKKANDRTVITATAQTAGRGRYKRTWVSRSGNLYASFIYKAEERDSRLSYAVGVAVAETLVKFGLKPKIKWPNDILIDGKKISGILIEYSDNFVVVGIGINVKTCPKIKEYETAKMNDYSDADATDVFNVLIKQIDKWRDADFETVRERWMSLATKINETVIYHGKQLKMIGLNENGALILRDDTRYILAYGDEISI